MITSKKKCLPALCKELYKFCLMNFLVTSADFEIFAWAFMNRYHIHIYIFNNMYKTFE